MKYDQRMWRFMECSFIDLKNRDRWYLDSLFEWMLTISIWGLSAVVVFGAGRLVSSPRVFVQYSSTNALLILCMCCTAFVSAIW